MPARGAQAALLLLHAARGGADPKAARDVGSVWTRASDDDRARGAGLGRAARCCPGLLRHHRQLDRHRDDPAYDLWRVAAEGGTRMDEWRARVRAARGLRAKARVAGRSVLVNVEHLTVVRGRPVSRREVVAEFFERPLRGLREQLSRARRGGGGRG